MDGAGELRPANRFAGPQVDGIERALRAGHRDERMAVLGIDGDGAARGLDQPLAPDRRHAAVLQVHAHDLPVVLERRLRQFLHHRLPARQFTRVLSCLRQTGCDNC